MISLQVNLNAYLFQKVVSCGAWFNKYEQLKFFDTRSCSLTFTTSIREDAYFPTAFAIMGALKYIYFSGKSWYLLKYFVIFFYSSLNSLTF